MSDELYMQRALELAKLGSGTVSPNPMVGCVIVLNDIILGEGYHRRAGEAHAEVNAINSVVNLKELSQATIYVTLEPCSFFGKTPACTDLIIKHKPQRVVVASKDPNPKVSGKGLKLLRDAGIAVDFGVLEDEAMELNRRFYINMQLSRPYVILKWAETTDGFIARENYDSKWISNSKSRQLVHKWRKQEDAILVGHKTVVYDNPSLNIRTWSGKNPVRVVLGKDTSLDAAASIFSKPEKVFYFNNERSDTIENTEYVKLKNSDDPKELLEHLHRDNICSIIVEGGSATIAKYIAQGLWDEARIFKSPKSFNEGIPAPSLKFVADKEFSILEDRLSIIHNPKTKEHWQKN